MVSGCFDMLHSGHVEFFRQAAQYGDLYVAIGSDKTIFDLKGRETVNSENERLFMIKAVTWVHDAFISKGAGILDFEAEIRELKPDYFVVNSDGHLPEKRALCQELGIEYVILERIPFEGLTSRSTTALRERDYLPYRIDLAGGWLDQPFVSKHCPGPVVTISLEPTMEFNERSGMAVSTRRHARELWGVKIPPGNYELLAKTLFCFDNPPGTKVISGSQDAIGLVFPGLAYAYYNGGYWPEHIEHRMDESLLSFVENSLYLVSLGPRFSDYDVLSETVFNKDLAGALAKAADANWNAILRQDIHKFGQSLRDSFDAQVAMFPHMMNDRVAALVNEYRDRALGWKLSGAGGGGYLILVAERPVQGAIRVIARRESN
ncbi:MAG: adenylyltransferase/cytidyltransferase family protein [Leptolinea sp.]|jgi:cytidyltransferase-like protein|nr:adenylyltransferase/cytidyltransferase family protein [Leptolinea sp.]